MLPFSAAAQEEEPELPPPAEASSSGEEEAPELSEAESSVVPERAPAPAIRQPARRPTRAAPSPRRSAAPAAPRFTTPATLAGLRSDLSNALGSHTRNGRWAIMVVSLTRGDTIYALNADELFNPASTMKLFTAALALERLGPDFQFNTEVLRAGVLDSSGVLHGNLILRGDGDPAFSNRFLRGRPDVPLDLLARLVAGAGVRRVTGDLIADAGAFERRTIPEGWNPRYLGYRYAAPFSALSVNENVVWVVVHPGTNGTPARVELEPASRFVTVRNLVRSNNGRGARIVVRRVNSGTIEARGLIGRRSGPRRYQVVVDDPPRFTAGAFVNALSAHGIVVDGDIRFGTTPRSAERVASLPSPPLSRMISVMNRESVNHYAEQIYRNAARGPDRQGVGSAEHAFEHLREFLHRKVGVQPGSIYAADGSGLSAHNQVTPRALIQLLDYGHRAPWSSTFHASLPVAGESELLRSRMRATPAQGNLHAKTGTTNSVISLAGYTTARNGEVIAFAFIYNGRDRWNARATIDEMGATLAGFIRE